MSHFTTIETQVRDLDALTDACRELGLIVTLAGTARGYGSNTRRGDAVIRLKGPYDIALNRNEDGTYGLATDWWGGHVEREVGTGFSKVLQLYAVQKAQREARRKGLTVQRRALSNGSIKLTIGGVR